MRREWPRRWPTGSGGEAVSLEDDQKEVLASLLKDFSKKTGKPTAPVEPIPAPAAAKDASVSLPSLSSTLTLTPRSWTR